MYANLMYAIFIYILVNEKRNSKIKYRMEKTICLIVRYIEVNELLF